MSHNVCDIMQDRKEHGKGKQVFPSRLFSIPSSDGETGDFKGNLQPPLFHVIGEQRGRKAGHGDSAHNCRCNTGGAFLTKIVSWT